MEGLAVGKDALRRFVANDGAAAHFPEPMGDCPVMFIMVHFIFILGKNILDNQFPNYTDLS